jgi:hypothetical protein
LAAYTNLRSNALLALDGSLGHVAEVLSGDYYQPLSTNSPHQIWSAAMIVSPILRGMMGLNVDARTCTADFAPHIPTDWRSFSLNNLRVGTTTLIFNYQRTPGALTLEVKREGSGDCTLNFSPSISLRSGVVSVELNGHGLQYRADANATDQHIAMRVPVTSNTNTIRIRLKNDFGLSIANVLPALGTASAGLRVLAQTWNQSRTQLTLSLSGLSGKSYDLSVWNPSQIASVKGGKLGEVHQDQAILSVEFPPQDPASYVHEEVVLNFAGSK